MENELEKIKELFRSDDILNHKLGLQLGRGLGMTDYEIIEMVLHDGKGWVIFDNDDYDAGYYDADYSKKIFGEFIHTCFYGNTNEENWEPDVEVLIKIPVIHYDWLYYPENELDILDRFKEFVNYITENE